MSRSRTATPDLPPVEVRPAATRLSLAVLFVTLCALWLLWSGTYTVDFAALLHAGDHGDAAHPPVNGLLVVLGLASCIGVTLLCRRMGIVDTEAIPVHLGLRIARYLPWLGWQVVLANLAVIRRVLRLRDMDRGETVVVEARQCSDMGRTIYANSITLTPGTVTVDVTDCTFTVHALTPYTADGVYDGEMDRRVAAIEERV